MAGGCSWWIRSAKRPNRCFADLDRAPYNPISGARDILPEQARLAAVVLYDAALAIEDHRRALGERILRPLRDSRVVRLARTREGCPGRAHSARELVGHRPTVGSANNVDRIEDKRHIERVVRLELAVEHRRFPIE